MKKLLVCSCGMLLVAANLQATVLFSDNFNSYTSGNLVGQGPWLQNGTTATYPVQVNNGKAMLGVTGQDVNAAVNPFTLVDGTTFYIGATLNLSAAQANGDYFLNWAPSTSTTIYSSRLYAKSTTGGFLLGYVEGAGTGASLTYGTQVLNLSQDYRVVIAYDVVAGGNVNDTARVYVSPADTSVEGNNTPYLTDAWTCVNPESTVLGSINFRQGSATAAPTLSVDDLVVGTLFSEVAAVPEPSALALFGLGASLLALRRRNS